MAIELVLCDEQEELWRKLMAKACLRSRDALLYVQTLSPDECVIVSAALADPNGPYFHDALEAYRAETKAMVDKIEAAWVAKHANLQAATEAIVLVERRNAKGA